MPLMFRVYHITTLGILRSFLSHTLNLYLIYIIVSSVNKIKVFSRIIVFAFSCMCGVQQIIVFLVVYAVCSRSLCFQLYVWCVVDHCVSSCVCGVQQIIVFSLLFYIFGPLCCLSVDIQLLITPLEYSNFISTVGHILVLIFYYKHYSTDVHIQIILSSGFWCNI